MESAVTPASRSRFDCHGTLASAHSTRFRSFRTCSASSSSRGMVSCRGFQYGDSAMQTSLTELPAAS